MSSTEHALLLCQTDQDLLLEVAHNSLVSGLDNRTAFTPHTEDYPEELRRVASSFVTLKQQGQLRGCIGALQGEIPLVEDVALHAYAAGFRDPRFAPITQEELEGLLIEISVLTPQTPLHFRDEAEFMAAIETGVDGVTIEDEGHTATFLPSVWEQLPDKVQFVSHLKQKAGMHAHHWSTSFKAWHYQTQQFAE